MKTYNVLVGAGYPAIKEPRCLRKDVVAILLTVSKIYPKSPVIFAGIGTSGATYISALLMADDTDKNNGMLLKKKGEKSHRIEVESGARYSFLSNEPIFIVDDIIDTGSTLVAISEILREKKIINRVVGIAIKGCNAEGEKFFRDLFPKVKYLIY